MTLVELGERLRALGAWDALNLDGGGSTAMVVNQRLVTVPSDGTGERPVANVLLVVGRAGARR
jgi:exopolysaccharide biosynthesis protein